MFIEISFLLNIIYYGPPEGYFELYIDRAPGRLPVNFSIVFFISETIKKAWIFI